MKLKIEVLDFDNKEGYVSYFGERYDQLPTYFTAEYLFSWAKYDKSRVFVIEIKSNYGTAYMPVLSFDLNNGYREFYSAYGYGGFIGFGEEDNIQILAKNIKENFGLLIKVLCSHNVVDIFIRNSPFTKNIEFFPRDYIQFNRHTVSVNLKDWSQSEFPSYFTSKQKWPIRYAIRNGLKLKVFDKSSIGKDVCRRFINLYDEAMKKNQADGYYYFSEDLLLENISIDRKAELLVAEYDNKIVGGSIFLIDSDWVHYHLSAIDYDYSKYQITDFIIYSAIKRYENLGKSFLHLGGGRSLDENEPLYKFKNRYGKIVGDYYISKVVINKPKYEKIRLDRKLETSKMFSIHDAMVVENSGEKANCRWRI